MGANVAFTVTPEDIHHFAEMGAYMEIANEKKKV